MPELEDAFSLKIIKDLAKVIVQNDTIRSFEIVPSFSSGNKNLSPVLFRNFALGLESWAVRYVLAYAHKQIISKSIIKDMPTFSACLLAVNLIHPEMQTAWNRRRELILQRRLPMCNEFRITRLALSNIPQCNEALAYRRWLISHELVPGDPQRRLNEELGLADLIANRYHSNYHAWAHRQWCLERLAPPLKGVLRNPNPHNVKVTKIEMYYIFSTTSLQVYLNELKINKQFNSTHVSDHSGFHFRSFLLNQIFYIFGNNAGTREADGESGKAAVFFYRWLKLNISDFLKDTEIKEEDKLTLSDIIVSLILFELKNNQMLIERCVGHESLWSFRRFLVHSLHSTVSKVNSKSNEVSLASAVLRKFVSKEQFFVLCQAAGPNDEQDISLLRNYCNWLNKVPGLNVHLL